MRGDGAGAETSRDAEALDAVAPSPEARRERLRRRVFTGLFLAAVPAVVGVALAFGGRVGAPAKTVRGPFGQHHEGLAERLKTAGVPTTGSSGSRAHFHPRLVVYVNGRQIPVPADIGIAPERPTAMATLHTHDDSGNLHAEGIERATLGQFFEVWGVSFSAQRLGPHRASGRSAVRLWVDGQASRAFGDLQLRDGQHVVVSFGDRYAPAPAAVAE